jgi:hypothetical protein
MSSTLGCLCGRPRSSARRRGRVVGRPGPADLPAGHTPCSVATLVATWPAAARRSITWRNAPAARAWSARFAAQRITPAHAWRRRHRAPEVWLLAERDRGATPRTKYYLVHLPATASPDLSSGSPINAGPSTAVSRTQRRTRPGSLRGPFAAGLQRHVALIAVAYTFCKSNASAACPVTSRSQRPRHPAGSPDRAPVCDAPALPPAHAQAPASVTADRQCISERFREACSALPASAARLRRWIERGALRHPARAHYTLVENAEPSAIGPPSAPAP